MSEHECTLQLGTYDFATTRPLKRSQEFVLRGTRWWLQPVIRAEHPPGLLQVHLESTDPSSYQGTTELRITVCVYGYKYGLVSEKQFVLGKVFTVKDKLSVPVGSAHLNHVALWPNDAKTRRYLHLKLAVTVHMEPVSDGDTSAAAASSLSCCVAGASGDGYHVNRGMSQAEMFSQVEETPPAGQEATRLVLVSSDRVAFYTHPMVMCRLSNVLKTRYQDPHARDQPIESRFERLKLRNSKTGVAEVYRPYKLRQSAYEIRALLAFMYVGDGFGQLSVQELTQVLQLAEYLQVDKGVKTAVANYVRNAMNERTWSMKDKMELVKLLVHRSCEDAIAVLVKDL